MSQASRLPYYRSHSFVQAAKITGIAPLEVPSPGKTFAISIDIPGPALLVGDGYMAKHSPQIGGYYVLYEDGYESFSPAGPFEDGYDKVLFPHGSESDLAVEQADSGV